MSDAKEEFILGETVSDIPLRRKKSRNIEAELFGQDRMNKMIDAFEESVGIKNKQFKKPNIVWKNILLSPGFDEEDRDLLNELLNDPEMYRIVQMDKTWTQRGEIKIFVIYTEDQDIKAARELDKDNDEQTS